MNCSVSFLVILLGAFFLSKAEESTNSDNIQMVNNVTDFLRNNPGVTLTKLNAVRSPRGFMYSLGQRRPEDHFLGFSQEYSPKWETPQDVQVMLKYPSIGTQGSVVTYVEIFMEHGAYVGNCYVLSGGIGQRSISILVEARGVTVLFYDAAFYGL